MSEHGRTRGAYRIRNGRRNLAVARFELAYQRSFRLNNVRRAHDQTERTVAVNMQPVRSHFDCGNGADVNKPNS